MAASDLIHLSALIDDAKCFDLIRHHRWPDGVHCPSCASLDVARNGRDDTQRERQLYICKSCDSRFDDLTGTVLARHHQPLRVWVLCLSFMGLNLSNLQIAKELDLDASDVQRMTSQLRDGLTARAPQTELSGTIEADEVYVVAGHKGYPEAVQKNRRGRRRRLKGAPGRGTLDKDKPSILGLIERGGQVVMRMLPNVQQKTIRPIIEAVVKAGSLIYTDEYDIDTRLPKWGFAHETVCHGKGEYAHDDDKDGFCEVHVNTMEGCWSLLRSWLRPHRGISQEKLPSYLGFFEFVHNARKRGKTLLAALIGALLVPETQPSPRNPS